MKFGPVPPAEAAGAILAHSLRVGGTALKKGRLLTAEDAAALAASGFASVTVARLEPGDLDENAAAARLAEAAGGAGTERSVAATGRVNLFARERGLAVIDAGRVAAANAIDEALTIATVSPFTAVEAGQVIATVKVITFGVAEAAIERWTAVAADAGAPVRVAAFRPRRISLVQTRLPGTKERSLDKTVEVTRARIDALGCTLTGEHRCAHDETAVAAALDAAAEQADIVLVLGASAIVDRRDVVPAAIAAAGGMVEHFGMPVDPGNLMLLARIGRIAVLGLPGSGRSPRLHGFDWVLQRLVAGLPVTGKDIAAMGVGGLLKDIPSRPLPRTRAAPQPVAGTALASRTPRVDAIVLAAGRSRRMSGRNKLLVEVDGAPMVTRVVDAVLASRVRSVTVVTGHDAERVRAALDGRSVRFVQNPDYRDGLSVSLRCGIAALPPEAEGVLVCLGDMPRVSATDIDRLIDRFNPAAGRAICVPVHDGKRGNPVLWARRFLPEMQALVGDSGARHLIGEHADEVCEVEMGGDGVLLDVDSPDTLAAL